MAKKKKSFGAGIHNVLTSINSETFSVGFSDVDLWADTGNYALNRMMSGRFFDGGLLLGRNYVYYGESGSGKSLEAAYVCANAQKQHDAFVVWIDVERANVGRVGEKFFQRAGISTHEDDFVYTNAATFADINKVLSDVLKHYRETFKEETDLRPIVFVIDSWSVVLTESQWENAKIGKVVGDQGQQAKQTGDLIKKINHLVGGLPALTIGVAHVYENQQKHPLTGQPIGGKHKPTGGHKIQYMASGCLMLSKKELMTENVEDADVAKRYEELEEGMTAEHKKKLKRRTIGIVSVAENLKSRVSKPFEKVEVQIPYFGGMDRYSGLFDLLMSEGTIYSPSVGWYAYKSNGKETKFRKADFRKHADDIMKSAVEDISDDSVGAEDEAKTA